MTREQMIAWLTLEGWEPMKDQRPDKPSPFSLYRGKERMWITIYGDPATIADSVNRRGHKPCAWRRIPQELLDYATKEKDHEPR